jgi:hypothetical protein
VPIASADLTEIFARHAIEPVNESVTVAGGREQFVKWSPVISPIEFETNALPQFGFVNLAARPFVQDVLVAGKNRFHAEHDWPLSKFRAAEQRGYGALRVGQGMIVTDQNDSSGGNGSVNIAWRKYFFVGAVRLAKIAQVFASAGGIRGANFAFDAGDSVELGSITPRS